MASYIAPLAISIFKESYSYNINTMDSTKEITSRLKFIGKIQSGEKINVKYMYVQPDGITTKISRTFIYPDNKRNTLAFVTDTINKGFEIVSTLSTSMESSEITLSKNLLEDLEKSKMGLSNLKETYLADIKFCCDMDTLMQDVDAKLTDYKSRFG